MTPDRRGRDAIAKEIEDAKRVREPAISNLVSSAGLFAALNGFHNLVTASRGIVRPDAYLCIGDAAARVQLCFF